MDFDFNIRNCADHKHDLFMEFCRLGTILHCVDCAKMENMPLKDAEKLMEISDVEA